MSRSTAAASSPAAVVGGRYELRALVGRGGMADVFRARDRTLGRDVAVKVLHRHLATDPTFLERFRREAIAAAALSHPNVVAVHDWGEDRDGAWLVLQLIEGPSLRDVLRVVGRMTPRQAAALIGPAAAGLGAAHAAGLVHRDVKPENLLIGNDGTVRITDFGLARAAASSSTTFGTGVVVGSPHYLAPEAVRGEPVDPRADVYALGIVLFECLTGGPPHHGDSPLATAMRHTTADVPPPSRFVADVDGALDELVRWSTARRRDARYDDATAFAWALAAAVPAPLDPLPRDVLEEAARRRAAALPTMEPPTGADRAREDAGEDGDAGDVGSHHAADDDHTRHLGTIGRVGGPTDRIEIDPRDVPTTVVPVRRRRGRRLLALAVLVAALAGGSRVLPPGVLDAAGTFVAGLGSRLAGVTAAPVDVPDVTGRPVEEATAELEALDLVVVVAPDRLNDPTVPAGHVLAQDPVGPARAGSTVSLVLSAGPRTVAVPTPTDSDPDTVAARLRDAGLVPAFERRHDDTVAAGEVVGLEPAAGTVVDEGATVRIVVSDGPPPVAVPSVVGLALGEASETLRAVGLELEVAARRYAAAPALTVLEQSTGPGTSVPRGSVVTVVVSDGPAPVAVPNLRGRTVGEALAELEALGLRAEVVRRGGPAAALQPDRVYDQDPGPGTLLEPGGTVVLWAYDA